MKIDLFKDSPCPGYFEAMVDEFGGLEFCLYRTQPNGQFAQYSIKNESEK